MCTVDYSNVFYQVKIIEIYTGVMLKLHVLNKDEDSDFWVKVNDWNLKLKKGKRKPKINR